MPELGALLNKLSGTPAWQRANAAWEGALASGAFEAAAHRVRMSVQSRRREGTATKALEALGSIPGQMVGSFKGMMDAAYAHPPGMSVQDNPQLTGLVAENALNVVGMPAMGGGMPGLGSGVSRGFQNVPDTLMGFRKSGPQRGYHETNYPHEQAVRVTFPDGLTWEDGIKGLNETHALERARRNWPGAKIEAIDVPVSALGSAAGKGTGSRLGQPPIGAQPTRELAPTEVLGEIGKGTLPVGGNSTTGAAGAQGPRTPQNTPRVMPNFTVQRGTIDAFLKNQGVPFRVEHSSSVGSPSTYYYVETPTGTKKIRVSDHLGGYGEHLDLRLGTSSEVALQKIADALGRPLEKGAAREMEIARLQENLTRWPDAPAAEKWRKALDALGSNFTDRKTGAGIVAANNAPEGQGIRAYHGTTRSAAEEIRRRGLQIPKDGEAASFWTDEPLEALEFARMKTADKKAAKVLSANIAPSNLHKVDAKGEVYDPDLMGRILAEARATGASGVEIRNIQNFEHGNPSTTYALFRDDIIDILKKYGLAGMAIPPAYQNAAEPQQ